MHFVWAGPGPGPARTASWRRTRVRNRGVPIHGTVCTTRSQPPTVLHRYAHPVDPGRHVWHEVRVMDELSEPELPSPPLALPDVDLLEILLMQYISMRVAAVVL